MRLPEMASPAHRTTSKDCSANTFQHTAGDEGNSGSIQTTDIEVCYATKHHSEPYFFCEP